MSIPLKNFRSPNQDNSIQNQPQSPINIQYLNISILLRNTRDKIFLNLKYNVVLQKPM